MRAQKKDIAELFGYPSDDLSVGARLAAQTQQCPFLGKKCTKFNHDQTVIYGTCSVSLNSASDSKYDIIICPKRLYADEYKVIRDVASSVWGVDASNRLIIGGTTDELKEKLEKTDKEFAYVAFGTNSGKEISINAGGRMSMDWVLQKYKIASNTIVALEFVGIEVQSIDITGNYRATHKAYIQLKTGRSVAEIPNSEHGLNWANVHKRLIPQIIRKGNVYRRAKKCVGFFFVVPHQVYKKFETVIGHIDEKAGHQRDRLSIVTYALSENLNIAGRRKIELVNKKIILLDDIILGFGVYVDPKATAALEAALESAI